VFYEPRGVYRDRDEIDRVVGAIKATHPDFRYPANCPGGGIGRYRADSMDKRSGTQLSGWAIYRKSRCCPPSRTPAKILT
jgi:hypothetical protein